MKIENEKGIDDLQEYLTELRNMQERFYVSHNNMFMHESDRDRFHQISIEITDLLDNLLGSNQYSSTIFSAYQNGLHNFSGTPSFHSVKQIDTCISAALTRIKRKPKTLKKINSSTFNPKPISPGQIKKVTAAWLYHNIPISMWLWFAGLLLSAFLLGITLMKNSQLFQGVVGMTCEPTSHKSPNSN
ncbi:MAG: hypothetical protein P8P14_01805 [Porticoccaceae bacterium]|nr:hypothetical protein [Porticoccaceae bacterium]